MQFDKWEGKHNTPSFKRQCHRVVKGWPLASVACTATTSRRVAASQVGNLSTQCWFLQTLSFIPHLLPLPLPCSPQPPSHHCCSPALGYGWRESRQRRRTAMFSHASEVHGHTQAQSSASWHIKSKVEWRVAGDHHFAPFWSQGFLYLSYLLNCRARSNNFTDGYELPCSCWELHQGPL